ncbi:hypothetical protein VPHD164_0020 [Vibrio phage D164]
MTIQVTGTLTDPSGVVASTVPIRIIALQGLGNVGAGAITIPVTSTAGVYDFQLEPGRYSIEIRYGQVYELQGRVIVNDDSPSPVNLSGLLALTQPLVPAEIALVRELVAQAEQAVVDAEAQVVLARQAVTDAQVQVALATSEANRSAAQVALAAAQVNLATAQADRAELEANRASEITGLDTVADAVDLAITNEYLTARTQGDVDAERALKREKFAGSGWEHFGKHFPKGASNVPVNQGLWTRQGTPNRLDIGRATSNTAIGTSKTDFAVMQMAGFTVQMERLNTGEASNAVMKFPEAPTGAVTYDSATGTVFDFETQVDPKYGNIAPDRNEAVARAFGAVRPSEIFQNGASTWDEDSETVTFNANGAAGVIGENILPDRESLTVTLTSNRQELIEFRDGSGGADTLLYSFTISANTRTTVTFNATGRVANRIYIRVPGANTGGTLQVENWEVRQGEVVTRRVDMWGFEGFLEAVTPSNPFVYPKGLIQSQAAEMNGIPTVQGTRPVSYYAVFDGDTDSVGVGVNFFAATAAQRETMLADPENNLYRLDDGRLVQFRVRQVTKAGAGNGDWQNVSPFSGQLGYGSINRLPIQGTADSVEDWIASGASNHYYGQSGVGEHTRGEFTAFTGNGGARNSVNGEAYFLVGGTVSRLNQGAYHPELNSFGSKNWNRTDAVGGDVWNGANANVGNTMAQAFNQTTVAGEIGARTPTGIIGQSSGRTNDNRLHDAIYADGLGGVVDYRWSANDRSNPKWGAQAKLGCESGDYRGLELLQRTRVYGDEHFNHPSNKIAVFSSEIVFYVDFASTTLIGERIAGYNPSTGESVSGVITRTSPSFLAIERSTASMPTGNFTPVLVSGGGDAYAILTTNLDVSVSGNFTRTDAIGDPVRLLATFPTGFEGGWLGLTTGLDRVLTRKAVGTLTVLRSFTDNNGASWTNSQAAINSSLNTIPASLTDPARTWLIPYTADAKKTRRSTNVELFNAYSGQYGVTAVAFFSPGWGALLFESMLGKVSTSTSSINGIIQTYPFTLLNLRSVNGLIEDFAGRESQHAPLMLAAPTNNSRGIKYAAHQVDDNGQATLNFIFNELDHNGTDWGDDNRLRVLDGTYTNQNGVTGLLANVDELAIPYGLIKNEV